MMKMWCFAVLICSLLCTGSFSPLLEPDKPNDPQKISLAPMKILHLQQPCPSDSILVNGDCECLPCKQELCQNGATLESTRPGHCCDCKIPVNYISCDVNGTQYQHNSTWKENCFTCNCYNGLKFCKQSPDCDLSVTEPNPEIEQVRSTGKTCLTDNGVYLHNEKWSSDLCTNCTCEDGEVKCIAHYCENNQKTYCEPIECNLICQYGLRISHTNNCEVCECALNPVLLDLTKQKHINPEHVYTIIELYNFIELKNNFENREVYFHSNRENSSHLSIFLMVLLVVLAMICGALFWRLIRSNKLRNTKMDLSKTPDLRNYIPVSN